MTTSLILLAVLSASQQPVLVEFYSTTCPDCQAMEPVVTQLQRDGFFLNRVDVSLYPASAREYGISKLPCYILLSGENEVARHTGTAPANTLRALLSQSNGKNGERQFAAVSNGSPQIRTSRDEVEISNSPKVVLPREIPTPTPAPRFSELAIRQILRATVRLGVVDTSHRSYGSGTIVAKSGSRVLIVTCGHMFEGMDKGTQVRVTVFSDATEEYYTGHVVSYDLDDDVGLVCAEAIRNATVVPIASADRKTERGEVVVVAGCDYAGAPLVKSTRVLAVNNFVGAETLVVEATPNHGRSGGGVFNANMELIGVCNGFTREDAKGIYTGLSAVLAEVTESQIDPESGRLTETYAGRTETAQNTQMPKRR